MKSIFLSLFVSGFAFAEKPNWKAFNSLELSSAQIVLDGKSPKPLKCPFETKSIFGKIEVHSFSFIVSCSSDFMGGFFLNDEVLAQKDADEGYSWDNQTILFFDEESKSLIWSMKAYSTYDTSIDCEGVSKVELKKQGWSAERIRDCRSGKVVCKKSEKFRKWDSKVQKFVSVNYKGKTPNKKISPFEGFLKNCP